MEETPIPLYSTKYKNNEEEKIIKYNEYKIKKNDINLDLILCKTKENIIIRSFYYEFKFNPSDLSLLTKIKFNSLDDTYEYIKNIFEQKKVKVKNITKKMVILILNIYDNKKNKEKEIEIILNAQIINDGFIIYNIVNKCLELENKINDIKNENTKLIEENKNLKEINKNLTEKYQKIKEENIDIKQENINIKNDISIIKIQLEQLNNKNNIEINKINQLNTNYKNNENDLQKKLMKQQMLQQQMIQQQMMQQQQKMNMMSLKNENTTEFKDIINVYFEKNGGKYMLQCFLNDKIYEIIQQYRIKSNDYTSKQFLFNGRFLKENLTVKESKLFDFAPITVV